MPKETVSQVKAQMAALLAPTSRAQDRKVWGISTNMVLVPFLTACRVEGAIKSDDVSDADLGAPIRQKRDKDTGELKHSKDGRPLFETAKAITQMGNRMRENYIAGLVAHTGTVMNERAKDFSAQVERQQRAGAPIIAKDAEDEEVYAFTQAQALLDATEAVDSPQLIAA